MLYKARGDLLTDYRFFFDLILRPNAELHDVLKLLGQVVPPIVVAQGMSSQIIFFCVLAAPTVGTHMISLPLGTDLSATNVTPSVGLSEYPLALRRGQSPSRAPAARSRSCHHLSALFA
jgi:hypothetical protein